MADSNQKVSNSAARWPMRFQLPNQLPNIARFADDAFDTSAITGPNSSSGEWKMYAEIENLKEDEDQEEIITKDAEYYKNKYQQRKHRRRYRQKHHINLENEESEIQFEGKVCNLFSAEKDYHGSSNSSDDAGFKYVLLQFVKREQADGASYQEVQVTPVADTYVFRKKGKVTDQLMPEIAEKFEEGKRKIKEQLSRFKAFSTGKHDDGDKNKAKDIGQEDEDESDIFSRAFAKGMTSRKGYKGPKSSSLQSFINENGIDLDDLKQEKSFLGLGGDFASRCADDEEDNVAFGQMKDIQQEEESAADAWRNQDVVSDDDEDDEEEEEEEGEDEGEERGVGNQGLDKSGSSWASMDPTRLTDKGTLTYGMLQSAAQLGQLLGAKQTTGPMPPPALKRSREDLLEQGNDGEVKRNRVSFGSIPTSEPVLETAPKSSLKASASSLSISTAATAALSETDYDLSDAGLRRFLQNKGGRVQINLVKETFKDKIREFSKKMKDKTAGKTKFLEIIERVTTHEEDPILGYVVALK